MGKRGVTTIAQYLFRQNSSIQIGIQSEHDSKCIFP